MLPAILRRKVVLKITGLSNSTMYRQIAAGVFPAPLRLGPRAVGWLESSVVEWVASRPQVGETNTVDGENAKKIKPHHFVRHPNLERKG